MTAVEKLIKVLIARRHELHLSQKEVAQRSEGSLHQSRLSQLESGRVESPSMAVLTAWADALMLEVSFVITYPDGRQRKL